MQKIWITLMIAAILVTACGPSQAQLASTATQAAADTSGTQTALAPTATSTSTQTTTPTVTPTSTSTSTPTQTFTSTPTLTPSPTDTPTVPPVVMSDEIQNEIKSYGYDPQSGRLLSLPEVIGPFTVDGPSYVMSFANDYGEMTEYILHYEVKIDKAARIAGCGAAFHTWYGFLAVDNSGTSMWVVSSFFMGMENYITQPAVTSAFQFTKDAFTPFTLVVKGRSITIYSGAEQIGQAEVDDASGAFGWMAYGVSGEGQVACTFQNAWAWLAK